MSVPNSCCTPCPELEIVLVPGAEGDFGTDGDDGTNGANAFTVTTDDFATVATSGTVPIEVADTSWMVTGQPLFIEGAGFYGVTAIVDSTHVTVENLGFTGNTAALVNIPAGAGVSPGGEQPSLTGLAHSGVNTDITEIQGLTTPLSEDQGGTGRTAPVTPLAVYGSGAAYVITTANAAVLIGATTIQIVLTTPGTWLLLANAKLAFAAVESTVGATFTTTLNRTNNTPGAVNEATLIFTITSPGTGTPLNRSTEAIAVPPIIYKTANSDDNIQMKAITTAVPNGAGDYTIDAASIVAVWLNSETS